MLIAVALLWLGSTRVLVATAALAARVPGGDAVRATPQGRPALERAQDPAAVASLPPEVPEIEPLEQLRGVPGNELLLVERGDRAVLAINEGEGLRSWITIHRRDGVWRIGEPPLP